MKRLVMMIAVACLAMPAAVAKSGSDDVDRQIVGAWQLQCTTPDGVPRTPIVLVGRQYQKHVAWYLGDEEPQPFENVRLQGDKLVGTLTPQERPDITITCEATLKAADQCTGTATYRSKDGRDTGNWAFSGQRLTPSSFAEAMTWKLSFVTPDNAQHEATVTVVSKNDKFYAWYSDKDHELPARALTVQGDRVELKISGESPEGTRVDVTFRGTVDGDAVQGNAEYRLPDQTGSFTFQAKRAS
jgi:hypothetical protein